MILFGLLDRFAESEWQGWDITWTLRSFALTTAGCMFMGTHDTTSPSESWGRQEVRHNTPSHNTSNSQCLYKDFSLAFQDSRRWQKCSTTCGTRFVISLPRTIAFCSEENMCWNFLREEERERIWSEANRENNRTGLNSVVFFCWWLLWRLLA